LRRHSGELPGAPACPPLLGAPPARYSGRHSWPLCGHPRPRFGAAPVSRLGETASLWRKIRIFRPPASESSRAVLLQEHGPMDCLNAVLDHPLSNPGICLTPMEYNATRVTEDTGNVTVATGNVTDITADAMNVPSPDSCRKVGELRIWSRSRLAGMDLVRILRGLAFWLAALLTFRSFNASAMFAAEAKHRSGHTQCRLLNGLSWVVSPRSGGKLGGRNSGSHHVSRLQSSPASRVSGPNPAPNSG
jgi:hypothetical protein